MLGLKDLIIDRITDAKQLNQQHHYNNYNKLGPLEAELQGNRSVLKMISHVKKKEKQRILQERSFLEQLFLIRFWQSGVLQNLYSVSVSIIGSYNSVYLSLLENGTSTSDKLSKLYCSFIEQQRSKVSSPQLLQVVEGNLTQQNPFVLLSFMAEWSSMFFNESLNNAMTQQFSRHEDQMKRINLSRSLIGIEHKTKTPNPLSISSNYQKTTQIIASPVVLTNKESVYAYFLDELNQYYKGLPLQLDSNFIKSMRKAYGKGGKEFQKDSTIQRAVSILIEAKNKHTKQQVDSFREAYCNKYPKKFKKVLSERQKKGQQKCKGNQSKKNPCQNRCFQRIKSQSKEEQSPQRKVNQNNANRNSLLLYPKTNQISFQSSNKLIKKIQKEKKNRQIQLPEIAPHKLTSGHSKSSAGRSKNYYSFLNPCNSISEDRKGDLISPKYYEFRQPKSIDQTLRDKNFSCTSQARKELSQNPEKKQKVPKISGQQLKRNRKLMLQLLRQKNRYAFLEK